MNEIATQAPADLSREAVEAFSRRRGEPDWLRLARLAAWERYEALPKPTTRDESWRRTDISALDLDRLARPAADDAPGAASPDAIAAAIGQAADQAGLLVLRNGKVERCELDDKLAERGVLFLSLAEAIAQEPEQVRRYLRPERERPSEGKLEALAAAFWNDGVFVYVPRGLSIESPFQVVHWSDAEGSALTRTIVVAEEASCLALVDSYASPPDHPESLASGTIEVIEGQAARVSYVHLQERDEQAWSFTSLCSEQERDSAMTWLLLGLGGRLSRNELTCALNGQGAEADLLGLVFGEANQHFDLQSLQDHVASDTRSDLVLKVALRDKATSNFTGLIRVGKTALRTSSNQENRNLLLSGEAKADSDPKLEILNSDVTRCGHGATVGPVDEEMIFYLMTRGLSHDEAERLIVEGFFEPLLGQVPIEGVRQRLWASIERKLQS